MATDVVVRGRYSEGRSPACKKLARFMELHVHTLNAGEEQEDWAGFMCINVTAVTYDSSNAIDDGPRKVHGPLYGLRESD